MSAGHVAPIKMYVAIFVALMVGTAVTVAVAFFDFGYMNNVIMLAIAVTKALLVILFFMHVRWSTRLTWVVAGAGFFWLLIMFTLTMADYMTRGWSPARCANIRPRACCTAAPCGPRSAPRLPPLAERPAPKFLLHRRVTAETGYTPFASTGETSHNYRERSQWRISRKTLRRSRSIIPSAPADARCSRSSSSWLLLSSASAATT